MYALVNWRLVEYSPGSEACVLSCVDQQLNPPTELIIITMYNTYKRCMKSYTNVTIINIIIIIVVIFIFMQMELSYFVICVYSTNTDQ